VGSQTPPSPRRGPPVPVWFPLTAPACEPRRLPGSWVTADPSLAMSEAAFDPFAAQGRRQSRPGRAALALRLRVYITRTRLDRRLVAGCQCESTAALALRARQLIDRRTQQRVARNLRRVVAYADRSERRAPFSAVVIDCAAVRAGREALLGLAERLAEGAPVHPRGVVLAQRLLTDGLDSPLCNPRCERSVDQAVWEVADALGADDPPTSVFDGVAC
jgi:hypothetical protein